MPSLQLGVGSSKAEVLLITSVALWDINEIILSAAKGSLVHRVVKGFLVVSHSEGLLMNSKATKP